MNRGGLIRYAANAITDPNHATSSSISLCLIPPISCSVMLTHVQLGQSGEPMLPSPKERLLQTQET